MILIVEDDYSVALVISKACWAAGLETRVASNGQEALDMIHGGLRPSAIILDLYMPILDGNGFLEKFQEFSRRPPVVVLSAYLDMLREDLKGIPAKLIRKPPDLTSLVDILVDCEKNYG